MNVKKTPKGKSAISGATIAASRTKPQSFQRIPFRSGLDCLGPNIGLGLNVERYQKGDLNK